MTPLPIDPHLPAILEALGRRRSLVLAAEPGAGKTTRVPPALLDSGLLAPEHPGVVVLQPRRVAARSAASRIAEERGWTVGGEVGFVVRLERRVGPRTRLRVVTEGVLNRQLLEDPTLDGVGAVVLDEFHERSVHTDLAVALLREVRQALREDLILIVMSATIDAEPIARFLDATILEVPGRVHPVAVSHRAADGRPLADRVRDAVADVLDRPGDVLAFLPGLEEIRRASRALGALADREGFSILPLHGSLPSDEQDRVLRPAQHRKVILSTNIAETSLTIDGVRAVIDGGLARVARHDPSRGLERLETMRISRASADQRAGRAGRTAPGRCIRLWAERESRGMPAFDEPEIRRVDLAGPVLALHAWGVADPSAFGWFEGPPAEALEAAGALLAQLGAVDRDDGRPTPIGLALLSLPVHPRIGRLLLAGVEGGILPEVAAAAAILSEKDFVFRRPDRRRPDRRGGSDVLDRVDLLGEAERAGFRSLGPEIDRHAARNVARVRDALMRAARRLGGGRRDSEGDVEAALARALLVAYPDRVCRRRGPGDDAARMVGGRGVRLDRDSTVRDAEFFLALDAREDRRSSGGPLELRVRLASAIEPEWLDELLPGDVTRGEVVRFDDGRGRVAAFATWTYRDLLLRESSTGSIDPARAAEALAEVLNRDPLGFVRGDDAASRWLDRFECLRSWLPELVWPAVDEPALADVVRSACVGKRSVEEVRRVPLVPLLQGRLAFDQLRLMDAEAPEALVVPSGNRVRLRYEVGAAPVLAVRIQELFGLPATPRVARGRVAVLLHLLGPNFRPVQVTDDLDSFWSTTYAQVRKDLRARYPKHSWPDDPRAASPEAKGGRRRSN